MRLYKHKEYYTTNIRSFGEVEKNVEHKNMGVVNLPDRVGVTHQFFSCVINILKILIDINYILDHTYYFVAFTHHALDILCHQILISTSPVE